MIRIFTAAVILCLTMTACGSSKTEIGSERAKEIALEHAGVKEEEASFVKTEKERDDGRTVYEVEFHTQNNVEYDYEIDAHTGNIVSYDSDAENFKAPN